MLTMREIKTLDVIKALINVMIYFRLNLLKLSARTQAKGLAPMN